MSIVIVHLRWDDVGPEEYAELRHWLSDGAGLPAGCLSRDFEHRGTVLTGTEVWTGETAARRFVEGLPVTSALAGLAPPMTAAFALPDQYAGPYLRRSGRPSAVPC
jgi:hypothetical protein